MLTWKHLCWSLDVSFLINVVGLKACNFIKKRLQHRFFLINIAKFLRTVFLQNTSGGCFYTHGWVAFAKDYHELKLFKFNLQFKYCYPEVQKTSSYNHQCMFWNSQRINNLTFKFLWKQSSVNWRWQARSQRLILFNHVLCNCIICKVVE